MMGLGHITLADGAIEHLSASDGIQRIEYHAKSPGARPHSHQAAPPASQARGRLTKWSVNCAGPKMDAGMKVGAYVG